MSGELIKPGAERPLILPMCATCELPVERFTLHPSFYHLTIEADCHGSHESATIPTEKAFEISRKKERFVMFYPRGRAAIFRY